MTDKKDLKALIRARMEKTGESYVTARRNLLAEKLTSTLKSAPVPSERRWLPTTTEADAKAALEKALAMSPTLSLYGMRGEEALYRLADEKATFEAQREKAIAEREQMRGALVHVAASMDWLTTQRRITRVNTQQSSYTYKHMVENWFELCRGGSVYVANGCFIAAALAMGFRGHGEDGSPNVWFPISQRSVDASRALIEEARARAEAERTPDYD